MSYREQVVVISPAAASFTIVCAHCAELDAAEGYSGSTLARVPLWNVGLDFDHGTFLCRRGHSVRVERDKSVRADAA